MARGTNHNKAWEKCNWRVGTCCLFREKLKLLEIIRVHRAAANATPLLPRAMYRRMLETSTDDSLSCAVQKGGVCASTIVPTYDPELCELSVNGFVILRLHRRQSQHAILCAFEKGGWPPRIEWPVVSDAENHHRDVLHRLNRGQSPQLIEFSCDGSGCGVRWRFIG